jgi:hypothetical protein
MRARSADGTLPGLVIVTSECRDGTTILIGDRRFASCIADVTSAVILSKDCRMTFVTFDLWSDPHESPFLAELSASDEAPLHQALGNLKNLLMR